MPVPPPEAMVKMRQGVVAAATALAKKAATAAPRPHVGDYIGLLRANEAQLAQAFRQAASNHPELPDMGPQCALFAGWSRDAAAGLGPFVGRYGQQQAGDPNRLGKLVRRRPTSTGFGQLRDLQALLVLVGESQSSLVILRQAVAALRDEGFATALADMAAKNGRQHQWLQSQILQAASQALVVPA